MNIVTKFYYKFVLYSWLKSFSKKYKIFFDCNKPKCFVFLAADYGNLGDVAITHVQEILLEEKYPNYQIVDIPISQTLQALHYVKRHLSSRDIITITGGGNMSDMYFDIELLRLLVVDTFPNNRIEVFPQSLIMSDNEKSKVLQVKMRKIYTAHKNLTIFAREKVSYIQMKELLPSVNIILTPDVVMTYSPELPEQVRHSITLCLREDKEKCESERLQRLSLVLSEKYDVVKYDTHIGGGGLSIRQRNDELQKIWMQFCRSQWVITDRLHGMIFAFITRTPAIVVSNNNHKIVGCYEWIKDCGYIHFVKDIDDNEIIKLITSKPSVSKFEILNTELKAKMLLQL